MPIFLDLRSDTVTRPTSAMHSALRSAALGDDVLGDDPTVRELENEAACALGKQAGLFVPSGTMSNLAAIMTHCAGAAFPEMIVGHRQHTHLYEVGNVARIAGVHSWVVPNEPDGTMRVELVDAAIRAKDVHHPRTMMVSIENTHNSCGGMPLTEEYVGQVAAVARRKDVKVHVDGARIFNAATALNTSAANLCAKADTVSVCLSKGLGSPAGSVLVGSKEFIEGARCARKALGGGMRQAGILAACGLVSLRVMTKRLDEDHRLAADLAKGLSQIDEISVDPSKVKTNILFFDVKDNKSEELVHLLKQDYGILLGAYSSKTVRIVTHHDVHYSKAEYILDAFKSSIHKIFQK